MPQPPKVWSKHILTILLLAAVVLATFWPVLRNDFVNFDDQTEIYQNPDLNPVTLNGLAWNWRHTRMTLYMPVTYTSWDAVAAIAPRDGRGVLLAWPFHLLNLCLHFLCVALIYLLILRLGGAAIPSALGAIVFAVHPIQTEAVAWASGMYTLLGVALSCLAMLIYFRSVEVQKRARRAALYLLATLIFLIALLSKPASAATPLVAIVIDLLILRRPLGAVAAAMLPWIALAGLTAVAARYFQSAAQVAHVPLPARVLVAFDAIGFYITKIVWPVPLVADYGRNPNWVANHSAAAIASAGLALLILIVGVWALRKRRWWFSAGVAVFIAGISPYLGLVPFDFQPVTTVTDRYAYFGMLGVAMLAAAAASKWRGARIVLIIAAVIWCGMSMRQSQRWHDTQELFTHTLAENPDSILANYVLAFEARRNGRLAEAEGYYRKSLDVWPENAAVLFNLGNLYLATNRLSDAAALYDRATKAQPTDANMHNNFGVALARLGNRAAAEREFQAAIDLRPEWVDPRNSLAKLRASSPVTQP